MMLIRNTYIYLSGVRAILNFLREGELPQRDRVRAVHREAQYYAIGPLLESLEDAQPLTGEKVRQAFLDLLPNYKGSITILNKCRFSWVFSWLNNCPFFFQKILSALWRLQSVVPCSGRLVLQNWRSVCTRRRCPSPLMKDRCSIRCGLSARRVRPSCLSTIVKLTCLSGPGRQWQMFMTFFTA